MNALRFRVWPTKTRGDGARIIEFGACLVRWPCIGPGVRLHLGWWKLAIWYGRPSYLKRGA